MSLMGREFSGVGDEAKSASLGCPRSLSTNVVGTYYVTDECNGCAYCALVAPDNFAFDKATSTYSVSRQPQTPQEAELVSDAVDDCPVNAIQVCKDV